MFVLTLISAASAAPPTDIQEVCASLLAGPAAIQEHIDVRAFAVGSAAARRWVRHGALASVLSAQVRQVGVAASVVEADEDHARILFVGRHGPFTLHLELGRKGHIADWSWAGDEMSARDRLAAASRGGDTGRKAMTELQTYTVASR